MRAPVLMFLAGLSACDKEFDPYADGTFSAPPIVSVSTPGEAVGMSVDLFNDEYKPGCESGKLSESQLNLLDLRRQSWLRAAGITNYPEWACLNGKANGPVD